MKLREDYTKMNRDLKHGHARRKSESVEHVAWKSMIARCGRPSHASYADYGGRGISVCNRWRESFEAFYADMGQRPSSGYSIERIDVNGNYEPSNCRWATRIEQHRNRRDNMVLEYQGSARTAVEWAEVTGLRPDTIRGRIRRGWNTEAALTRVPAARTVAQ